MKRRHSGRVWLAGAVASVALAGSGLNAPRAVFAQSSASLSVASVRQAYPLDCEASALEAALSGVGISASQDAILANIGADPRSPVLSRGRPVQWGDPYQSFVGDVHGRMLVSGYGVYYPPIVAAAQAMGAAAVGGEGWSPATLYQEVALGHPVIVWAPHLMAAVSVGQWTAWDGRAVWYSPQEHTQTLVGFDYGTSTVTLANPIDGRLHSYGMSLFEQRFAAFRSSAVVISPGPGVHFAPLSPGSRASSAIAVTDNRIQALPPSGASFGGAQTWSTTPFYGSRATLFATVDGPGHGAAAVAVDDANIFVMRNVGGSFGPVTAWSSVPFYGSRGTVMADVDGSGFASAVAINDGSIWVMLNNRQGGFRPPEQWSASPFYGTRGTFMAVIDGTGRASAVAINDDSMWVMPNSVGRLGPPEPRSQGAFYGTRGTFMADVDGQGRASPVAMNDASIWVERNNGGGSFAAPTVWSSQPFYGEWEYLADLDGSGRASAIAVSRAAIWVEQNTGGGFGPPAEWDGAPFYGTH